MKLQEIWMVMSSKYKQWIKTEFDSFRDYVKFPFIDNETVWQHFWMNNKNGIYT